MDLFYFGKEVREGRCFHLWWNFFVFQPDGKSGWYRTLMWNPKLRQTIIKVKEGD
jgi:hypothetical protein